MTWKELIANISLGYLVPEVTLRHTDLPGGEGVVISRKVRDRDSGEWGEISVTYPLWGFPAGVSEENAVRSAAGEILFHVQQNLGHEASEHFRFRGERIFDPHKKEC